MAINFLNNVDFNSIQSQNIVIENFTSDAAAGTGVEGQLYWNTTVPSLRGYDVSLGAWIPIGTINDILTFAGDAGGNQTVDLNTQTFTVGGTANEIKTSGTGQTLSISLADGAYNATPGAGTNLELPDGTAAVTQTAGDNTRKVATTAFVTTAVAASDTLAEVLAIGNTTGGTNLAVSAGDDITFTDTSKAIFGTGGDLEIYHNGSTSYITHSNAGDFRITTTGTGYIKLMNNLASMIDCAPGDKVALFYNGTKKFETTTDGVKITGGLQDVNNSLGAAGQVLSSTGTALDWVDDNDTTYTLPVAAGASNTAQIVLTPNTGATNTVSFIGTTGRIAISETTGINGSIGIDFPTNVVTIGSLEVGTTLAVSGTGQSSFAGQVTIPQTPVADTDAASKKFVLDQVAGLGTFQGGYDASTDPGSPALTGASNIAFGQGDFYAVTTEGTITFSDSPTGDATLEVGDFIFSNTDITANSNPASTDFTLIIADQNIAEAGATDSATPKGISGFDSAMFTVTPAGWVQLDHQLNPYGRKILLNSALGYVTRTVANGLTEFVINIDDDAVFGYPGVGRVALAENVKVEVIDNSAPFQTVYADITRSGSANLSIIFSGTIADSDYQALLVYV